MGQIETYKSNIKIEILFSRCLIVYICFCFIVLYSEQMRFNMLMCLINGIKYVNGIVFSL